MEFRVLGPLEVAEDGRRLAVASGRQRALLAFLVINANRVVSAERIIDELWGEEPPESGAKTVAFHVSRLRDALGPGRRKGEPDGVLVTEPAGYVLRVEPDSIDAARFERLSAEGRALLGDDPDAARTRLVDALALWRGEPYADVAFESFAQAEIRRLDELRLRALEDRFEAELALGRHAEVIADLETLVAVNPLRERLRGQLMTALYRAGRQAEALRAYGEGRRLLSEELGVDPSPELAQLESWILHQDPRLDGPTRRQAVRNPYKGLRPFSEADAADFFGREALVARLIERLGRVARAGRFLLVVGPSGAGKSSVVRAGLVPALRSGVLPGSERWPVALMQPGSRPFAEFAAALRAITPNAAADRGEHDGSLAAAVECAMPPEAAHLVLVVDQLEELFSLTADEAERARFLAALTQAVSAEDGRLLVVATLRADFFDRPLLAPGLGELVRTGTEVVTPLARDELERAIVRPAESVGVQLEPGLTTEMIADVARQPGGLPLLQYALTELFERSDGRRLTREGYAATGGVVGALGRRAEETYAGLDPGAREIARQALLRLVAADEGGEATGRRVPRLELRDLAEEERRVDEVVDEFGRWRLLSFDRDPVSGEPTVEVAHEALLSRWPRLAGWIEEKREDIWMRRRLADAAGEWTRAGRDAGFLLAGSRLDLFASWAASTDLRLDAPERELLDASLAERRRQDEAEAARAAHEQALERRAARGLRALAAVLAVAALVATSLSVVVYSQGETAREQAAIASGRELAAASVGNLGTDPGLSLLLALEAARATAGRGYVVEQAMDALHWALQELHVAYPGDDAPIAVRSSPHGLRGVMLLPPEQLMALAASNAKRTLTPEECRTYLHLAACPDPPSAPDDTRALAVYTASGTVPVERLASASLAGTRVDAVSLLPADMTPLTSTLEDRSGIELAWATGADADLEARVASGDLPDAAIVSRPAVVAKLARAGLLVDMSGFIELERLRSAAGGYLVGLGTVGADGTWPAAEGSLFGAPVVVEASSLVWYPKAAFEQASYRVPRTLDELSALVEQMTSDGHTPWCLGLEDGANSGASAADFVEELVLSTAGPDQYDGWATGNGSFEHIAIAAAFADFRRMVLQDGHVLLGTGAIGSIPRGLAAWPMFLDPPGCWLHLGGGTDRRSWPKGRSDVLAAFPFPAADPGSSGAVRGHAYELVVFRDRPEVRRLIEFLLGGEVASTGTTDLVSAGLWPTGDAAGTAPADPVARAEGGLVREALRAGTFRVDASDLMPPAVAARFERDMLDYVAWGPESLDSVLADIELTRRGASR